ncbi:MAG TPA: polyprenyl synthetase family protein [Candidatus Bathyarchaeia archaeon]|nr:polyprenyl synthetase family protein [Candidatus Bathyarchaeia archaeon]
MTPDPLTRIVKMGRKVDPIICKALADASSPKFQSPVTYHFRTGGKRMRATLVLLACAACGGRVKDGLNPAALVEMIHNYSLVMDDLIDRGEVRRGKPTVRVQFGDSVALLVAMLYREALDDLIEKCIPPSKTRVVAVQAMKDIIEGERLDLLLEQAGRTDPYLKTQRFREPSFDLYIDMIGKKTAALFKAASQIGAHSAHANSPIVQSLGEFGWKAGLAFQIMDDVLDICGQETGKQIGKDIIEHKLGNAAILMALRYLPRTKRSEILTILSSEKVSQAMVKRARHLVMETPAEKDCREIAAKYLQEAKGQLSILRESVYRDGLATLSDAIVSRTF